MWVDLLINFFSGPNAVSISLSPLNNFIMIGLASRKLHWQITQHQVNLFYFFSQSCALRVLRVTADLWVLGDFVFTLVN